MGKENSLKNLAAPFQKGQSGNPAGKAPGTRNFSTLLRKYLNTTELVPQATYPTIIKNPNGKRMKQMEIIAMELIKKCRDGNLKAIDMMADRLEGKPMQHHELRNLDAVAPSDPMKPDTNTLIITTAQPPKADGTI